MNCQTAQSLMNLALDGELEASARTQWEAHLHQCAACAEFFRVATLRETKLRTALAAAGDEATESVWQQAEMGVKTAEAAAQWALHALEGHQRSSTVERPQAGRWTDWLWPHPRFYVGLAAVWVLSFGLHLLTPGTIAQGGACVAITTPMEPASLWEQRRELAGLIENGSGDKSASPGPKKESRIHPSEPAGGLRQSMISKTRMEIAIQSTKHTNESRDLLT